MSWQVYALLSAAAAAATALLGKVGVEGVPSLLATAVRSIVVTVVAWACVVAWGQQSAVPTLTRRTVLFLGLSGVATAVSWLAYMRALQMAPASLVAPLDKLSLPLTVLLAALLLGEPLTPHLVIGVGLMTIGAALASAQT